MRVLSLFLKHPYLYSAESKFRIIIPSCVLSYCVERKRSVWWLWSCMMGLKWTSHCSSHFYSSSVVVVGCIDNVINLTLYRSLLTCYIKILLMLTTYGFSMTNILLYLALVQLSTVYRLKSSFIALRIYFLIKTSGYHQLFPSTTKVTIIVSINPSKSKTLRSLIKAKMNSLWTLVLPYTETQGCGE